MSSTNKYEYTIDQESDSVNRYAFTEEQSCRISSRSDVKRLFDISKLQVCVESLRHRFWVSGLLLNPSKSSLMYFGTGSRLQNTVLPTQVMVAGSNVDVPDSLQILGVTLVLGWHTVAGQTC